VRATLQITAVTGAALLAGAARGAVPAAGAENPPERLVHRFMRVEISPDGTLVAAVEGDAPRSGYLPAVRDLVIRSLRGGVERRIVVPCGRVPQCWPGSPTWAADSRHLSFTLRTPASHAYAIYTVAADGAGLERRLDFQGTISELRYLPDGRLAMLATQNARKEVGATEAGAPIAGDLDEAVPEQRIAVLDHDALEWASPQDLYVYEYDWRPGGGFVGTAAPGDGDNNWWTAKLYAFPLAGAAQVLYSPQDIRQQIAGPKVSRDGRSVAFIAGLMSDFGSTGGEVYTVPLAGGPTVRVTPDLAASATSLVWGCSGHLLAGMLAGESTEVVDLGSGAAASSPHVLVSMPAESLSERDTGVSWSCASGLTATVHESFTSPPEIEAGPLGHWKDLTSVNAGMRMPLSVRSITWRSDGFDVQGWLLLPEHVTGKIPLVTIVHGGPAAAAEPVFTGPGLYRMLLERGYALFRPNPRGSYGQSERFTQANVRDFGHGDLRDILAGIDAAEKVAPIDEARLGITGGSYGGFMSMFAVTQTPRFKAAVAAAGISNWLSYYGENGIDAWMIPYFGASAYEDPEVYARSSAINYIRSVRTPTFAYVGELDIECPAPQTREFWHALKALGVPTGVMIYPGEGHGLREPEHIADALQRTLDWFERYLK